MVAVTKESDYLKLVGDKLLAKGIIEIVVMYSGFGVADGCHSKVVFRDKDGNECSRAVLSEPVFENSALTGEDIFEIYLRSSCIRTNKSVKAGSYHINVADWTHVRQEVISTHPDALIAALMPPMAKDDPIRR